MHAVLRVLIITGISSSISVMLKPWNSVCGESTHCGIARLFLIRTSGPWTYVALNRLTVPPWLTRRPTLCPVVSDSCRCTYA
jgi:hypothetical protein